MRAIKPLQQPVHVDVCVPGSKSYTHRMLIAAALSDGACTIQDALDSEDTTPDPRGAFEMGCCRGAQRERGCRHGPGGRVDGLRRGDFSRELGHLHAAAHGRGGPGPGQDHPDRRRAHAGPADPASPGRPDATGSGGPFDRRQRLPAGGSLGGRCERRPHPFELLGQQPVSFGTPAHRALHPPGDRNRRHPGPGLPALRRHHARQPGPVRRCKRTPGL